MEVVLREIEKAIWKIGYLEVVPPEAKKFLTEDQYRHAVEQFEMLAFEPEPSRSRTVDVRPIEQFHELRDKGGMLGKINLRVYFVIVKDKKALIVLGACKKENEDRAPRHLVIRMRNRMRIALDLLK